MKIKVTTNPRSLLNPPKWINEEDLTDEMEIIARENDIIMSFRNMKYKIFKIPIGLFCGITLKSNKDVSKLGENDVPKGVYIFSNIENKIALEHEYMRLYYKDHTRNIILSDINMGSPVFEKFIVYTETSLYLCVADPSDIITEAVFTSAEYINGSDRMIKKKVLPTPSLP